YLIRAYSWDLWGAAYMIGGGCSNGAFWDFSSTLIMQGKDFFDAALADPDRLADFDYSQDNENNYPFLEGYGWYAQRLIEQKGGKVPDFRWPGEPAGYRWQEDE